MIGATAGTTTAAARAATTALSVLVVTNQTADDKTNCCYQNHTDDDRCPHIFSSFKLAFTNLLEDTTSLLLCQVFFRL